jgi:hypothetical protein
MFAKQLLGKVTQKTFGTTFLKGCLEKVAQKLWGLQYIFY